MNKNQLTKLTTAGIMAACLAGCVSTSKTNSSITKADFGKMPDGTPVEICTLHNAKGAEARIMTYGGIVQKLTMPDRNGNFADIVLGYDNLEGYVGQRKATLFRRAHRPLWQPHRRREVHAGRPDLYAGEEQQRQFAARRRKGFRQGRLDGAGRRSARTARNWCCRI